MKEQIAILVKEKPKHFSKMIKNNAEMKKWVEDNTLIVSDNFAEMTYSALQQENPICANGNKKRFINISDGFGYCGMTKNCQCAQTAISEKVSASKSRRTKEEIDAENAKRESTNIRKYGVANAGQTDLAKQKHHEFYADSSRVKTITDNHREYCLEKFGVNNPKKCHISPDSLVILDDKVKFIEYISKQTSTATVLDELGITGYTLYDRLSKYDIDWKSTNTAYKSKAELEILEFIKSIYDGEVISGDRKQLWPNELDIYVPKLQLAIEYCGLYWHSDNFKDKSYHIQKQIRCGEKGIKLITIFEDEWNSKKEIIKSRLKHSMKSAKSIFARKCEIKEITKVLADKFILNYHLQGVFSSNYNFGLYFGTKLVAVMTFGKSRFNKNFEYELVRFCSSEAISGGASKLFSHFVKTYNPKSIVSYSDNRWGDGGLYEKLGFEKLDKKVVPTYYYTDYQFRYNRQKFQKHKLVKEGFDISKSESEIMKERGFGKIWDCGQTTWKWII